MVSFNSRVLANRRGDINLFILQHEIHPFAAVIAAVAKSKKTIDVAAHWRLFNFLQK
jgi:hypothetical protein